MTQFTICFYTSLDNSIGMFLSNMQIEDMCNRTRASAVPVVPESEGCINC